MPSSEAASVVQRRAVLARVAVVVLALAACSGGDEQGDAGVDGSARDAGARGEDAGSDAGRVPDAGTRAGGWTRVDGLPVTCPVFIAGDPRAAVSGPLRFVPCGDIEGCRRLEVDWPVSSGPRLTFHGVRGSFSEGRFHFGFERSYGRDERWRLRVVATDSGEVRAVLRAQAPDPVRGRCTAGPMAVTERAAYVTFLEASASRAINGLHVLRVPTDSPGQPAQVLASLSTADLGGMRGAQDVVAHDGSVAIFVVPGGDILRVGHDGSTSWLTDASMRSPVLEDAANDLVLLNHGWPDATIWAARGRELASPFISGSDAAFNPHTDGADIVWLQAYGWIHGAGRWERTELWASSFAADPADLEPRRVVEDAPFTYVLAFGHGVAAVEEPEPVALSLWALTGERLGALPVPRDTELRGTIILAMGEESVAYSPTWRVRPYGGEHETLRIQRYDSLAP